MPALIKTLDQLYIYVAIQIAGDQVVSRAAVADLTTWETAYAPGGGSAGNVALIPGDPDSLLFYGHFGTDVQVVKHTISTGANVVLGLALGSDVVNCLEVNPGDPDHHYIAADNGEVHVTYDGGASYDLVTSSVGISTFAGMRVIWGGQYTPDELIFAGDNAGPTLIYTPNECVEVLDLTGAALGAVNAITGIDLG